MEQQTSYDPSLVTNTEFLSELAQATPDGSCLWVNKFHGDPGPESPWGGFVYTPSDHQREMCDDWNDYNTYFSVASVRQGTDGMFHRRRANFSRMLCLVVDDVELESLLSAPSWVLETSPGKTQAGFFLDSEDPDCADEELCSAVVKSMTMRGFIGGDKSGNNSVRYVRLPGGTNQKPRTTGHFRHRLRVWRPSIRLTLEDACAAVGMDLDLIKLSPYTSASSVPSQPGMPSLNLPQNEKLAEAARLVMSGQFHEPLNILSSSMIASGAHPAAVTNLLRGLMEAYPGPHDQRWEQRMKDIPRCVFDAEKKFARPVASSSVVLALPLIDQATGEVLNAKPPLFEHVGESMGTLKRTQWAIERYLEQDALSVVYGPSGVGKSFVVISMACCVATGTSWFGMPVHQGPVFYIAGEGHNGLMRRFKAWSQDTGVSLDKAPLFKSRRAVLMLDPSAAADLREEIDRLFAQHGRPSMIVVDTLARNFGDGDENAAKDMGRFVSELDKIRSQYHCHIMVVHHSGHGQERARGSSSLRAAIDQEISIGGKAGHIGLQVTKMKDEEEPSPRMFKIKQLQIAKDEDGEPILGATIELDGDPMDFEVGRTTGGSVVTARMVVDHVRVHGWSGYEAMAISTGLSVATARRVTDRCVKDHGLLEKSGRGFTLTDKAAFDPKTAIDRLIDASQS